MVHHELLFTNRLAFSAEQMLGFPSAKIDDYELLTNVLQSQGIQCEGERGLQENLGKLATLSHLDQSTLQNIEGIIKVTGETVYSKTIGALSTKEQISDITNTMTPYLQKGLIVTLSTPTIKQSGIVSNLQGQWTLIGTNTKGVNEVAINQKITDLHNKASVNNEHLTVTLSRLKEHLLRNTDVMVDLKKKQMGLLSTLAKPGMP
jgi:hypothetical protein